MTKRATTIACLCAAAVLAAGIAFTAGCSGYYGGKSLGDYDEDAAVTQQGGFLVEKGDYIYFVNGDESYTADNKYGNVVKGAIMRLSREDLAKRNYASAEMVVPYVVYSGNTDTGIFIYGDRVYYATPSTEKNSDGEVLNDYLEFKSTRLDGTRTMKSYYVQVDSNTTEYRYVEAGGTVYLLYVAEDESYYDETTGVTNLHSINTETGDNTILAYNISSYIFDSDNVSNPRVYYTMGVENYSSGSSFSYNQVYTVRADAADDENVTPVIYNEDEISDSIPEITGWTTKADLEDDDDDDNDNDYDRYMNYGDLVFDGIGTIDYSTNGNGYPTGYTMFNYGFGKDTDGGEIYYNGVSYTYSLSAYTNGYLFYTRNTSNLSNYLFYQEESDVLSGNYVSGTWNPVDSNPESGTKLLADGSSASSYYYLFDDEGAFDGVLYAESTGISVNYFDEDGSLRAEERVEVEDPQTGEKQSVLQTEDRANETSKYYYIDRDSVATILFTDGDDLYYSTTGTNGISIWRVNYTGSWSDYNGMPTEVDYTDEFIPVQILDIDAVSGWYNPAIVDGQMIFAADFDDMTTFNYLMVCDLRATDENGDFVLEDEKDPYSYKMMTNKEISAYNDKLSDLQDAIDDYNDTDTYPDADYANMYNAIQFAYLTRDNDYIDDLAVMCNDAVWDEDEDADPVYSDKTLALYHNFLRVSGDWKDYADDYKMINGEKVYANTRDYYYSLFGVMSDDDADSWLDAAKSSYLQDEPDISWYDSLSTAWKVVFIVGMCLCGLVVLAAIAILVIFLVKRSRRRGPGRAAGRIKVETDVNREENVYDTASADIPQDTVMDMEGNIISGNSDASDESAEPEEVDPDEPASDAPAEGGDEPKTE